MMNLGENNVMLISLSIQLETNTIPEDGGSRFLRKLVATYETKVHGATAQRITI
jgi:hypothetical protein